MSEDCFICSTNHHVCKEKIEKKLGEKAQKSLVRAAETPKEDLITAPLSTVTSVWVRDVCYKLQLLVMSAPEINQISHSKDVVNLLHSVIERIVWQAKVSIILILLR